MSEALRALIRRQIAQTGPMSIADYMALCLAHPEHGYYASRDPLGKSGDFTTAPEISQMFGELLGAWCVITWRQIGSPAPFALVELGPGRGTLMRDALRASARAEDFQAALSVHLVETSPVLRGRQKDALGDRAVTWHDSIETLPHVPLITLANEFFDALPIRQFVRGPQQWAERCVVLAEDGETLSFGLSPRGALAASLLPREAAPGDVAELNLAAVSNCTSLARRIVRDGGALLAIDYGYAEGHGDTLQALHAHAPIDLLAAPGESDVTAHVDFAALARAAEQAGAQAHGPVEQGALLHTLGLTARADALARAHPEQRETLAAAVRRLTDEAEMGRLFKALAVTRQGAAPPAGFEVQFEDS
jgi:NADH dehydrogenase [ubiquinone] 1 alpha subcomplex assembly factor 7